MTIRYHTDLIQGSDEWHAARCGLLTASEFKLILTPTLKIAENDKSRKHMWELAAQRISQYVEPTYIGEDMLRGHEDEFYARQIYSEKVAPVEEVGFVTNDRWGFVLGCSPDGLVGTDGGIEAKSRRQKYQVQTIVENFRDGTIPEDFILQVQGEMLVCEREWWDFLSYSGGLHMAAIRVYADPKMQEAILNAAAIYETRIAAIIADYSAALETEPRLFPTERRIEQEMFA